MTFPLDGKKFLLIAMLILLGEWASKLDSKTLTAIVGGLVFGGQQFSAWQSRRRADKAKAHEAETEKETNRQLGEIHLTVNSNFDKQSKLLEKANADLEAARQGLGEAQGEIKSLRAEFMTALTKLAPPVVSPGAAPVSIPLVVTISPASATVPPPDVKS